MQIQESDGKRANQLWLGRAIYRTVKGDQGHPQLPCLERACNGSR